MKGSFCKSLRFKELFSMMCQFIPLVSNLVGQILHYDRKPNYLGFPGTAFLGPSTGGSSSSWEVNFSDGQSGEVYLSTVSGSTWT